MPCEIETVCERSLRPLHGSVPIGGRPFRCDAGDFQKDYTRGRLLTRRSQLQEYELARIRVNREMGTTGCRRANR